MSSAIALGRNAVAVAAIAFGAAVVGFGAVTSVVPTVAHGEPSNPSSDPEPDPGSEEDYGGGGGSDYNPTVPTFNKPTSTISAQTIERRKPDTPPPVVTPRPVPVEIPRIPVNTPQVPVDIPVVVAPPPPPVVVPVQVPIPPPVQRPVAPPPTAPPLPPSPRVFLTSSAEPGTQAMTVILMFTVAGLWVYAHRIVSHWTTGRKTSASTAG